MRRVDPGDGCLLYTSIVLRGYRGLPKSLIYGPTKAALINFAEALYLDLQAKGILSLIHI